jgi:hypothetical protein
LHALDKAFAAQGDLLREALLPEPQVSRGDRQGRMPLGGTQPEETCETRAD